MSAGKVSWIILTNSIVCNYNNRSHTLEKGSHQYEQFVDALRSNRIDDLPSIIDKNVQLSKKMAEISKAFEIKDGVMYCDGEAVDNYVAKRIIEFHDARLPYEPLVNFWRRLRTNPSKNSVEQLYRFLEVCKCPITEDGLFVSVKGVHATDDPNVFYSGHDKRFTYTLGKYSEMPRSEVEDNPSNACGKGLHAGSYSYAKGWAPIVIELLIDPSDVVSVPYDHNSEKLRACRVLPIAVHQGSPYRGGVAVSSTKAEKKSAVVVNDGMAKMTIGDVMYTYTSASAAAFTNVTDIELVALLPNVSGVVRYRASKAPAAIRAVFNSSGFVLKEAFKFFFVGIDAPLFFVRSADEGNEQNVKYSLVYPESVKDAVSVLAYCSRDSSEMAVAPIVNYFKTEGTQLHDVTFAGQGYHVYGVKIDVGLREFVEEKGAGIIDSVVRIKPSKAPAGLRAIFSDITELYRIAFIGDEEAPLFIFSTAGEFKAKYNAFIMRKA